MHYKPNTIAQKLGLTRSYVNGIVRLIQKGENDLISRVEAGRLPIEVAIKICTGTEADIQRTLSDAYESGTLRGGKLRVVQQLIARRKTGKKVAKEKLALSTKDLVRMYQRHTAQQRALVHRSAVIRERLAILVSCFQQLFADDHFLTLLRAEGFRDMPVQLRARLDALSPKA